MYHLHHTLCQRYGPPAVHLVADGEGVQEISKVSQNIKGECSRALKVVLIGFSAKKTYILSINMTYYDKI